MSEDSELEVDYGLEEQQIIQEDIAGCLVETELTTAGEEEVGGDDDEDLEDEELEEDEQLVIQEEVVINNMNNGSDCGIAVGVDDAFEGSEELEEDEEDLDGDEEEPGEVVEDLLSLDDMNSTEAPLTAEDNSLNAIDDNDSNNELIIDANDANVGDDEELVAKEEKVGENEVYQWSAFTGLRVKTFTAEELAQFRKPFELGWKREVVLRGTVTSSGKKIGDVYYFSPDKKTKLRSYVEMGLFLKRNGSGLQPENFTFARQPIYQPPAEIVRHAMQRGGGQHQVQPSQIIDQAPFTPAAAPQPKPISSGGDGMSADRSARNSTASESEEQFSMSIAEGRAKRKRQAPTRFEDEDYAESSPFKKKSHREKGPGGAPSPMVSGGKPLAMSASGKQMPLQPKPHLSLQEKRRQLQHQLLQQVHEQTMKRQAAQDGHQKQLQQQHQQNSTISSAPTTTTVITTTPVLLVATNGTGDQLKSITTNSNSNNTNETEINITKIDSNGKQIIMPLNARKSISASAPLVKPKVEVEEPKTLLIVNTDISDKSDVEAPAPTATGAAPQQENQTTGAPCSMHCPGRRGMLPNLMCSRCFCLYHLDCVPGGVFLEEPRVFVCPNCLKPEDTNKSKDGKVNCEQSMITNGMSDGSGMSPDRDPVIMPKAQQSLFVSSAPILIQQPMVKSRTTFAPILPKPPQLQSGLYQQHQQRQKKQFPTATVPPLAPFNKSAAMNVKLPAGTHLYRVATGPNGHSMIVKDKSIKPKLKNARKSIGAPTHSSTPSPHLQNGLPQMPFYRPAPIAPIAPIKLTPQQIERQLRQILHPSKGRKRRGYREWMDKRTAAVQSLVSPYLCLNQVLSYLTVTDLVRLRKVSRVWLKLSSQPFLWRDLKLKGILINDWQYLARNIIETNGSIDLDFDGIKHLAQNNTDLCDLWRNFATIVDYLKSVKKLRFGSIPTFVLEEVINAAVTDNPYNSFSNLELLSVRNVFEEDSDIKECRLAFLSDFQTLTSLKTLQINCKNGFIADSPSVDLLTQVFKSMALETLVLTSLKDFSSEQFVFLTSLKGLKHLEIGSCVNWFQSSESEPKEQLVSSSSEVTVTDKNALNGPFKYLSELTTLTSLRLVDITIDDCSQNLPQMLESLITLESLTIDNLRIETSGMDVLDHLCAVLKSLPIQQFSISSDDSHTNKCLLDLLKKLDNCAKLLWKVGVLVEDSGECFVPFKKDDDSAEDADGEQDLTQESDQLADHLRGQSIKFMDLTFLNELIQSELSNALIEIIPQ